MFGSQISISRCQHLTSLLLRSNQLLCTIHHTFFAQNVKFLMVFSGLGEADKHELFVCLSNSLSACLDISSCVSVCLSVFLQILHTRKEKVSCTSVNFLLRKGKLLS